MPKDPLMHIKMLVANRDTNSTNRKPMLWILRKS